MYALTRPSHLMVDPLTTRNSVLGLHQFVRGEYKRIKVNPRVKSQKVDMQSMRSDIEEVASMDQSENPLKEYMDWHVVNGIDRVDKQLLMIANVLIEDENTSDLLEKYSGELRRLRNQNGGFIYAESVEKTFKLYVEVEKEKSRLDNYRMDMFQSAERQLKSAVKSVAVLDRFPGTYRILFPGHKFLTGEVENYSEAVIVPSKLLK